MRLPTLAFDAIPLEQIARYLINGVTAACVHFLLLFIYLEHLGIPSAGLANLLAAIGGVTVSFLGSRYFVFRAHHLPMLGQAWRFFVLYGLIALLHGSVLFAWTDLGGRDYRIGFLIATGLQVILSYLGNKFLVFRDS
jgi:putative flippase GtrA